MLMTTTRVLPTPVRTLLAAAAALCVPTAAAFAIADEEPASKPAGNSAAAPAPAPAPEAVPSDYDAPPPRPRAFVRVGASWQSLDFLTRARTVPLFGGNIGGGVYLAQKTPVLRNIILAGDIGFLWGDRDDGVIAAESYRPPAAFPGTSYAGWTDRLERRTDWFALPLLATLSYDLRLGDFSLRAGPVAGATLLHARTVFEGNIHDGAGAFAAAYDPSPARVRGTKFIFSYGAAAGLAWRLTPHLGVDAQYRFLAGTPLHYGSPTEHRRLGESVSHTLNISVSWRF